MNDPVGHCDDGEREQKCVVTDVAVTNDSRIRQKEDEKNQDLREPLERVVGLKTTGRGSMDIR